MRRAMCSLVIAGCFVLAHGGFSLAGPSPKPAQPPRTDQWRYTFYNGEWWYWLPENRWVYWQNNRWNDYSGAQTTSQFSGTVAAERLGAASTDQPASEEETGPFYGHAESNWGVPSSSVSGDIRPFYGHAGSSWGVYAPGDTNIGPFYGRAVPQESPYSSSSDNSEIGPFYGH